MTQLRTIGAVCRSQLTGRVLAVATTIMALLLAPLSQAADETVGRQLLSGHLRPEFAQAARVGKLADTAMLHLAISLPASHPDQLQALARDVGDPRSPSFHQFLTAAKFAARFAANEKDYHAVIAFVRANGMTVTATYPDRLLLGVSGTAAAVSRAFHTSLVTRRRSDGSLFYAPEREPSVDLNTKILFVSGLDDLDVRKPSGGSGPNGELGGSDFRDAYANGVTLQGQGQSVGLFEYDGFYQADITGYAQTFPSEFAGQAPPVTVAAALNGFVATASQPGQPGQSGPPQGGCNGTAPSPPPAGTPTNEEPAVDIEMAIAMAPRLAHVFVYEGCNGDQILQSMTQAVKGVLPLQLSASWSIPTDSGAVQIYQKMATYGQSFLWAAGDNNTTCPTGSQALRATMPDVTSVGGTVLQVANNTRASETAAADGGGLLAGFPIPAYQQGIAPNVSNPSGLQMAPDVSAMSGDGSKFAVYAYYQGGNSGYASYRGTSVAAPLWAGYVALVNQSRAQQGFSPVGWLNPLLYYIGASPTHYAQDFYDITSGTSPAPPTTGQYACANGASYSAQVGFDLVTGLGSPNANLINDLTTAPSYVLYCQGPLTTSNNATKFTWSHQAASVTPPASGHCAWADRGPRGSERHAHYTNVLLGQISQVTSFGAGTYWAVDVYRSQQRDNDLVVTGVFGVVTPPFSSEILLPLP